MKVYIVLFAIVFAGFSPAQEIEHPPAEQQIWFNQSEKATPDDGNYTTTGEHRSNTTSYGIPMHFSKEHHGPEMPRWGDDINVMVHGNPTMGTLSSDQDEQTGAIYASLLVPKADINDTVYTYRSIDGGLTWEPFMIQYGDSVSGGIRDHEILVGHDASDTWVYSFCLYDAPDPNSGIWVLRMRPDTSDYAWTQIIPYGDTLQNISVDRNIENPQHMFACWQTDVLQIRMQSSSDYSLTWGNQRYVALNSRNPDVCAGGDGYVYIAYQRNDTSEVRIGRYTNNLINPSYDFNSVDPGSEGDFNPSIAAARTYPGVNQTAWVLYRHHYTGDSSKVHYGWTTNGGSSWNYSTWPPIDNPHTTVEMTHPYARYSYNDSLLRAVAVVPEVGDDSLVYSLARTSTPTTWEERGVYNDFGATDEFGAVVDYSSLCSGGYLIYREHDLPYVWFDAYSITGILETRTDAPHNIVSLAPNPAKDNCILTFTLDKPGQIQVAIFDATGRFITDICDVTRSAGTFRQPLRLEDWAAGIYFVRIETDTSIQTRAMTVLR